ncbi:hypothetical protein [Rhizobium sp. TRM95796]|uniref:hypothetical protein n=1 Tax=Rhizobium sp. TRM95796 TaxID=2979862 RepID=UPI0021E96FE4|nr:hypothetical protein [Rhizobium sp. TRM95796]MCV3765302.1 hypothetical protein [Rhizobium sp. TRM95796]
MARVMMILFAHCLACLGALASGVFLLVGLDVLKGAAEPEALAIAVGPMVLLGSLLLAGVQFIPVCLIVLLAEWRSLRGLRYYLVSGLVLGLVSSLGGIEYGKASGEDLLGVVALIYALSGLVWGVIYWRMAGRTAGAWRDALPPAK